MSSESSLLCGGVSGPLSLGRGLRAVARLGPTDQISDNSKVFIAQGEHPWIEQSWC